MVERDVGDAVDKCEEWCMGTVHGAVIPASVTVCSSAEPWASKVPPANGPTKMARWSRNAVSTSGTRFLGACSLFPYESDFAQSLYLPTYHEMLRRRCSNGT